MKHGDISNHRSFIIGVRVEDCLFKYRTEGVKNSIMNLVKGRNHNAEIDPSVLSLLRYIYERTDYTISLVVDKENYTDEMKAALEDLKVPYNQVGLVLNSLSEVSTMLFTGELSYYVDSCYNRLSRVNNRYAMDVAQFNSLLKRRRV